MATVVLDDAPVASAATASRRWPRLAAAPLAGLALAAAFPPVDVWVLAPVAVAVLSWCCAGRPVRRGALAALLFGLAFFVPLLAWLRPVGTDAWLLLAVSQAAFLGALGAALAIVRRLPLWPVWVACAWVAEEWARDRLPFGGFPWGRLAFAAAGTPYDGLAALGGAPLVTFAVALSGALLAAAVRRPRAAAVRAAAAACLVVLCGLAVPTPTAGEGARPSAVVAVVQGNVPRLGLSAFEQRAAVLDNHVTETLRLAASGPRPDLVIWPENATDIDPFVDPAARAAITGAAVAVGAPVLVGAVLDAGPRSVRNAGVVWDPQTGPGASYAKRHPVPFGEYVPFRPVLDRLIGRFALVPRDFRAGTRPGVLDVGAARVGDVICFEIAYDGIVRDAVRGGGRMLVVQTNNATFGRHGETEQQLAMSRIRAIEHGRAVVVAATSGISAVIAPDGRVADSTTVFTADTIVQRVPLRDARTVADRLGAGPEAVLALLGIGAVGAGLRRRRA